jgi:hypothetical protein
MTTAQGNPALIAQAQSTQLVARYIALRRAQIERAVAQASKA